MRLLLLLPILAVTGCVTSRPVTLPDGKQGFAIKCHGARRDIGDCMNEAARVCGGKYQILTQDGIVAGGVVAPVGNSAVFMQGVHRTLIVSCGQSAVPKDE